MSQLFPRPLRQPLLRTACCARSGLFSTAAASGAALSRTFSVPAARPKAGKGHDPEAFDWWQLYVQGVCPDYPPRQRMYEQLRAAGVDVMRMEIHEVEDWVKWLEMRKVYGEKFPRFPFGLTLANKLEELKEKYPAKQ
eukprot:GDKI01027604.1.p1 GENE.GDKI01027604.1~~GDKI01027604.1.p1  ORF type:complete len:138 (+),score=27.88 GDKI01027604.1:84-497(+)